MCRALHEQGIDVLLASTDAELDDVSDLPRERPMNYKGLPVILFPKQIGESFKYSRPFSRWLNENVANFDLVHIHAVFNHSCIAAAQACQRQGVPYIVRPLGTLDPWSMKQKSLRKKVFWHSGIKRMLTRAAAIHYTAKAEKEAVESSLGLNHGFVVPLGVVMKTVDAHPTVHDSEFLERPYVLVLSRLHPKKALDMLIEAFLSVIQDRAFSEWRLVIAGDGDPAYVDSLKRLVAEREGKSFVIFTGWLEAERKEAALRNAALLALPSRQENFGLCVAEAMSLGVPVLVSPQVNLAEDIRSSACGWVAELDLIPLAQALAEAMGNKGERAARGNSGLELAKRKFAWPAIAVDLARFYAAAIQKNSASSRLIA